MALIFTTCFLLFLYAARILKYRKAWVGKAEYILNSSNVPDKQDIFQSFSTPSAPSTSSNSSSPASLSSLSSSLTVSIVIPFKNEYSNLSSLISGLSNQSFNVSEYEIICINDHSSDGSMELISTLVEGNPLFRILNLPEGESGKKAAIDQGIFSSRSDIILITDADCVHGEKWVEVMVHFYKDCHGRLISGPVRMSADCSFFSKFQSLEYLSLMGTGAASFLDGRPVMCSAANLCFEKSLYMEAKDCLYKDFPSGDDMFLMLFLNEQYPGRGMFIKSKDAIVTTKALKERQAFFRQRTRWSSKAPLYRDWNLIYLAILVFILNLSIVILAAGIFFGLKFLIAFSLIITLKSLLDRSFLKSITKFMGQSNLMKIFLPSQIIYPFYIVIIALSGFFVFFAKKKF